MNIIIKNKGTEILDKRHYVASGGEGHIYVKGDVAYKIYNTPTKMIQEKKIQELSALTSPNIIKPENIIQNDSQKSIGYTMKFLKDTVSLCQLFTRAFKDRNLIKTAIIISLINQMRDNIQHCHKNNILIVDLNEMNFLVSKTFKDVYFIDVDSYQTPSFPATALMESIRDRHATKFSENTDWFSFGIISFQMLIGIHPFKGKHIKYKDLDSRMQNNISVFNNQVSIPPVALSFNIIPANYKSWYKKIFNSNERIAPPFDDKFIVPDVATIIKTVKGTSHFIVNLIWEYEGDIIGFEYNPQLGRIIITNKGIVLGSSLYPINEKYVIGIYTDKIILATTHNGKLQLKNFHTDVKILCDINAHEVFSINQALYIKTEDSINRIDFLQFANNIIVSQKIECNILVNATQIFDGVIFQNLLDAYYISIINEVGHHQIRINELTEYRIMSAKYSREILIVCAEKNGKYTNFIFKFNATWSYTYKKNEDVNYAEPEFVVLDNGICAYVNENGYLELFFTNSVDGSSKIIEDTILEDAKLFCEGNQVLFSKGNKLYDIKIK